MAKTDPKTMRFEEDVYQYVMDYPKGENFSEKFHQMVNDVKADEKNKAQRLAILDVQILKAKDDLFKIEQAVRANKALQYNLNQLMESVSEITKDVVVIQNNRAAC